ncbi:MFS transporter [Mesorhizobium sp. LHD-90]|uniref:MFS transporter n=1 Tax=Mesorhizobium sp. LHD-90 TaxID=3071414 RepID=UPI0027E17ACA|nr:MFS transporter [Mesorhizobium sp. LHD-90]MDQ6435482.1 MFS transporter [Mesorhizobium sp. LHD-90]
MTRDVQPKLLTALCYAAMMCLAIGVNLLPVFLTSIGATFGGEQPLSQEELGRLGAVTFAGLVAGIVVTGPVADRFGAKPFVLLANLLMVSGLAGMALAGDYGELLVMVFILGLGAGMLDMILSPVVAALNPERRTAAMNWLHSYFCVGSVVTVLIGMTALALGIDWRIVCWLLILFPLGLTAAFLPMRFPALVADSGRTPMSALLRRAWFLAALLAIFLGGATELGMSQWLPAYAEISLGFLPAVAASGLLFFSVAMALGRMAVGMLEDRVNPYAVLAVGAATSVVLFLLGAFLQNPTLALLACIAAGFAGSSLWPTMLAVAADRYPDGGASMFAVLAAFGNAGGILMPWVVGAVGDLHDLRWGIATSAIAPLLMLPLVGLLFVSLRARRLLEA